MRYDLHVHTNLSDCAQREAYPEPFIAIAEKLGQSVLGFADHSWAKGVEGASPWYKKQPFDRLIERRESLNRYLDEHPTDVNVLIGAEGEYANFLLGVDEDAAAVTDYIIIPHDHVHMKGFVIPDGYNHAEVAKFLLDSFESLCVHPKRDLFVGLCHPLVPCCHPWEYKNEVYRHITDAQIHDALCAAKKAGIWLELNVSEFAGVPENEWHNYEYARFFHAAKENGNLLYRGSDAHGHAAYENYLGIADRIDAFLGLCDDDFAAVEQMALAIKRK